MLYDKVRLLTKVKADSQKPLYIEEKKEEHPVVSSRKEKRDIQILIRFVHIFCRERHGEDSKKPFSPPIEEVAALIDRGVRLCESCSELLTYGVRKRFRCPHSPKPMCKKCEAQCYNRHYKQRVREVMRVSGPYLIKRGRLDLLYHYLA
jgi:hypothetical protein